MARGWTRPFDTSTDEGRSRERYRRVGITFVSTVAGRGAAAAATLIAVPVMLRYLGPERYGLWAAISSAGMALLFADLGIGNGLLSVLAEDAGRHDRPSARKHVSSAFAALTLVALALGAAFALIYPHVPWSACCAPPARPRCANPARRWPCSWPASWRPCPDHRQPRAPRPPGRVREHGLVGGRHFVGLALLMAGIQQGASLPWLVLGLCGGPLLALLAQSVVLFTVQEPWLQPRPSAASREAARRILRLGFAFAVLQLAGAAAIASDALVASMVLGPVAAAKFAVVAALFDLPLSLLAMLLTPMWPAYGEALARRDVGWMKKALRRSVLVSAAFGWWWEAACVVAGGPLLRVWVGEAMVPSLALLALMALRLLALCVGQAMSVFLNGARLIRLQLAFGPLMAVVAVALKVVLGARLGLLGIVAGGVAAQVLLGLVPYGLALRRWGWGPGQGKGRVAGLRGPGPPGPDARSRATLSRRYIVARERPRARAAFSTLPPCSRTACSTRASSSASAAAGAAAARRAPPAARRGARARAGRGRPAAAPAPACCSARGCFRARDRTAGSDHVREAPCRRRPARPAGAPPAPPGRPRGRAAAAP